ncbi:hypothetical protein ILUMI_05301 [Ignelater luminosus]|uniref:Nucleoporin p54 n=1 Tax=Ignelater luminosus TaxID=2038154 RepID=A0A8K0DBA9_IGNLU|nr:hypothetical protein ILUMI_05301 [Ignelater luminosus]
MSFNFGAPSSTFGSTQNKPTAFGTPLGFGTPATTASTGFGFGPTFGAGTSQQQPAFGASAAQQPAFGSTFGQPAAGATAPSFGSTFGQTASAAPAFGTAFGTPASAAPAFGSTFGTPATSAPAFGSAFGATASTAPAFGSTFGAGASTTPAFGAGTTTTPAFGATASAAPAFGAAASAAPAFGAASTTPAFGSTFGAPTTTPSLFGTPAASKPSLFGTPSTTTTSLFGTPAAAPSLFGASTTTQAPSLFGGTTVTSTAPSLFGTTTTTTPSLFGSAFGASATTSAPSLFGPAATAGFGLGTTTTGSTGFSLFGSTTTTTTAPSLFGGFGKTATTASGFTGFGAGGTGFTGFGTTTTTSAPSWFGGASTLTGNRPPVPPSVLGASPAQTQVQQALASVLAINLFGDERDNILKKWNMLQACWGTGKGYFNPNQPPVEYNFSNPFFRYRAISYVVIPGEDNSHGIVKLVFNKKESELSNQKDALSNGILGVLGNKPNLSVHINNIKSIGDNQSEVMFSVSEKGVTGSSRRIPATDLCAYLNQPVQKQQLTSVGVLFIGAYVSPTKAQIQEYLKNSPPGIEMQAWHAAQADNPNPLKYMPSVVNGFGDLKKRMLREQYETGLHRGYLEKINKDIDELKKKHANSIAKINELKQKYAQLHHRLLKIIIKQEVTRKVGMALQPEEEVLRGRLESLAVQLSLPTQFKGQLHEIKCRMNLMEFPNTQNYERYKMEPNVQEDIKQFLKMEQNGIAHLINIINTDMKHLKIIADGLAKLQNK